MRAIALILALSATLACTTGSAAEVRYFPVPEGARPHDVAPAPDGAVWYTGQGAGHVGRLDPETGKVETIPLGEGSRPHGVIVGPDGAAWVTDGGLNANVRIDAKTKEVTVFPMPKDFPEANLNTGTFDKKGVYWFTGQNGVYGRVDPATGKTQAWKAPKGRGPYGITTTPKGEIWYASLAGDHLGEIDAVSGEVTVIEPPRAGVGPRRIWSDSKGMLWVSLWHAGEVGRYDPVGKTWKTWPVNDAKFGCYAVYVDNEDKVWLTDFATNAIVRFDPATEKIERFPSNRKNAAVRQMLGRPGEVWGAESGTDRLVLIKN